ncbi:MULTISPECIES: AMP-binding protein, partial [Comamonas]|uniref:AMP-binding protein n=1 Tax=Comamonas TaxID=283 RepID=UPI00237DE77F
MSRMPPPYHAGAVALDNGRQRWTFAELDHLRADMARQFSHLGTRVLASLLDNGPAWVVADAAARDAAVVHVPLPAFFTPAQIAHALAVAGVDTVLTVPARPPA